MAPQGIAPLSYASIVVGFISFAFTFFTFVRVFWETILTLWSAPKELERVVDNLRLELHEERAYLKSMIRRSKSRSRGRKLHAELGPLRLLNDSVRDLMNDFKKLEEPFLSEPADVKEKDVERSEVSIIIFWWFFCSFPGNIKPYFQTLWRYSQLTIGKRLVYEGFADP